MMGYHNGNDRFYKFLMEFWIAINRSQSIFKVQCLFEVEQKLNVVNDCHVLDHVLANVFLN